MFGYLLLAISISAFGGLLFFLIIGQPSGVGIAAFVVLVIAGVFWQKKKKDKNNSN